MMRLSDFSNALRRMLIYLWISGVLLSNPSWAATLDNFEINTDNTAVKIILHTDQRLNYTTENDGKHFSIILPDTQLSQDQVKRGMPVVIDNKNKFIGRALPLEGGRVKIMLPNLTPNRYAISVLQRTGGTAKPSTLPTRSPLNEDDHTFEAIAKSFQENPNKPATWAGYSVNIPPTKQISALSTKHPVKLHRSNVRVTHTPPHRQKVLRVAALPKAKATFHRPPSAQPENIATIALADHPSPRPIAQSPLRAYRASEAVKPQRFKRYQAPQSQPGFAQQLQKTLTGFPTWLLGLLSILSGGIGLLGIVGFVIFVKRLFSGTPQPTFSKIQATSPERPNPLQAHQASSELIQSEESQARPQLLNFEDQAAINAFSYLIQPTENIDEAVQNAVLLRLPHTLRKRDPKQRKPQALGKRTFGKTGATFPAPFTLQDR